MKQDESLANAHLENDPRYVEAVALMGKIQRDLAAVETRREEILVRIAPGRSSVESSAHALLAGQDSTAPDYAASADTLRSESEVLSAKRCILVKAIELQSQSIKELRYQISSKISLELRPRHGALVRDIVRQLKALDSALEAETDFRNTLNERDIVYDAHIRPMGIYQLGLLRDAHSPVANFLLEAEQFGYLNASDLPAHVRERILIPAPKKQTALPKETADGWASA